MLALVTWMLCCFMQSTPDVSPANPPAETTPPADSNEVTPDDSAAEEPEGAPDKVSDEPEEDTWLLRYKFTEGQQLRYLSEQESTVDAQASGARKTDISKVEQQRLFTVNSVTDDSISHLVMQFEHVRMEIQSDDREPVVFDSSMSPDEVPQLFQQAAHRLKGSAARYNLTSTGVAVTDESEEKRTKPGAAKAAQDTTSFLIPLPEKPVSVGDTWKIETTVKVRVTAEINRDVVILRSFRLKEINDGIAMITFDASVMSKTPSVTVRSQLIQATPKGQAEFDIARGLMLAREIRFDETVLGALGPQTVLASWGNTSEQLLETPAPSATSAR
jgi:Family of unknown function (DUF6263)